GAHVLDDQSTAVRAARCHYYLSAAAHLWAVVSNIPPSVSAADPSGPSESPYRLSTTRTPVSAALRRATRGSIASSAKMAFAPSRRIVSCSSAISRAEGSALVLSPGITVPTTSRPYRSAK